MEKEQWELLEGELEKLGMSVSAYCSEAVNEKLIGATNLDVVTELRAIRREFQDLKEDVESLRGTLVAATKGTMFVVGKGKPVRREDVEKWAEENLAKK